MFPSVSMRLDLSSSPLIPTLLGRPRRPVIRPRHSLDCKPRTGDRAMFAQISFDRSRCAMRSPGVDAHLVHEDSIPESGSSPSNESVPLRSSVAASLLQSGLPCMDRRLRRMMSPWPDAQGHPLASGSASAANPSLNCCDWTYGAPWTENGSFGNRGRSLSQVDKRIRHFITQQATKSELFELIKSRLIAAGDYVGLVRELECALNA